MNLESITPISALLPLKDSSQYLPRLEKMLNLNLSTFDQIVLVDDDGDGEQTKMIEDWRNRDGRVTVVKGARNGLVSALNLGLDACNHSWVARFDADDIYPEHRLGEQRKLINSSTVAVFSDYSFISQKGFPLGTIPSPVFHAPTAVSLVTSQRTAHPSVLFNLDAVRSVGGYRNSDYLVEDLSLWLRLAKVGNLVSSPKVLLNYRIHAQSISVANREKMKLNSQMVVNEIGIQYESISELIQNFDFYHHEYSFLTFSAERKILALRELEACSEVLSFTDEDRLGFQELKRKYSLGTKDKLAYVRLAFGAVSRRLARRI